MRTKNNQIKPIEYWASDKIIQFVKPLVMAIVNLTPDSFYDGGKYGAAGDIISDVEEKIKQGANIIDIGAVSTRPQAKEIPENEEWLRLELTLKDLRKRFPKLLISIDTYRASVAKRAADCGADIINDIGGGTLDSNMFATVAALNLPYVLTHIKGTPATMQNDPRYNDVTEEVISGLSEKINVLAELNFHKIIVDPGFGFGKTLDHNYTLLKNLRRFEDLNFPLLVGISRKGMINQVIQTSPVTALNGSTVLNTIALLNGASILRVHDVNEALQTIQLVQYYKHV